MNIKFIDHSQEVIIEMHNKVAYALDQMAKAALFYIDVYVPKDTGTLANSMAHYVEPFNRVVIGTPVEYGKYVEYREELRHAAPTKAHFLRDSLLDYMDEYRELIKEKLKSDL